MSSAVTAAYPLAQEIAEELTRRDIGTAKQREPGWQQIGWTVQRMKPLRGRRLGRPWFGGGEPLRNRLCVILAETKGTPEVHSRKEIVN
jgi:hypothetical protein